MTADVVIVGAGPVGMSAAALLDAAGVAVELVDLAAGVNPHYSRATTVHPRTLEVLRGVRGSTSGSIVERMVEQGTRLPMTHFGLLTRLLDYRGLDTEFPFVLMIPQARTEGLLADHLGERGVPIHRGVEVVDLEQDERGVRLTTRRGGRTDFLEAPFVVGADGARSAVRGILGVPFPGSEPSMCGFVADVELDRPPSHPHLWQVGKGTLNALPLPDGAFRVFGTEARDTGLDPQTVRRRRDEPLDIDALRASMRRIAGDDWGVRAMRWDPATPTPPATSSTTGWGGCSWSATPPTSTCPRVVRASTSGSRTRRTSRGSSPPRSGAGRLRTCASGRTATRRSGCRSLGGSRPTRWPRPRCR
ncbi:FAD binding domain-containing protein [Umezawaea tangerina]|uniref:FAD binding domain-containing protein n=1 Tax=Umezawaea tangerina TaxID=84725 RepID=A0A2T0T018_9PSEU|nr:FAD binding domain-containing protein [Umezawaea tangerina]